MREYISWVKEQFVIERKSLLVSRMTCRKNGSLETARQLSCTLDIKNSKIFLQSRNFQVGVLLLSVLGFFAFKYVKDRRKNHGEYRPQFEEQHHAKDLPYLQPPNVEGLIWWNFFEWAMFYVYLLFPVMLLSLPSNFYPTRMTFLCCISCSSGWILE